MNGVRCRRPSHAVVIDLIRVIFIGGGGDSEPGSWVGGGVEG